MSDSRIEFPDGVDGARLYLWPLLVDAWRESSEYRRAVTFDSPLRFAMTYFGHYLRNRRTGVISFSVAHLAMDAAAHEWMRPEPSRHAWVMPRGAAKSTWQFLILPAWALAHGHRRFFLSFSLTSAQAEAHLANLRRELVDNELLLADFPQLRRRRGAGSSDTKATVTMGGATIAARGLGGNTLGVRSGEQRPDLILGDDLEPSPDQHTPERADKIRTALTEAILPMGDETTATSICGTTTMHGGLAHDVVLAALPAEDPDHAVAPWIAAGGWRCHYWPALLDEGTADERSLWPQRWSVAELHDKRAKAPGDYARNYANRPERVAESGWWRRDLFAYDRHREVIRRVLYVDPAMTNNRTSDQTALVMAGLDRDGRTAVIEYAEAGAWHGRDLLDRMWRLTEAVPRTLREWYVEKNQGGDRWSSDILRPLPPGVELHLDHVRGHKKDRIEAALSHYQRGAVVHAHELPQLERQQCEWTPAKDRDDLLDACAGALRALGI